MIPASRNRRVARRLLLPVMLAALTASGCAGLGKKDKPQTPTVGERTPILSHIATKVTVDPALANVAVTLPAAQLNEEWAQAGGNAAKNPGHVALSSAPSQVWSAQIAGTSKKRRLAAAPVVGGGKLFAVGTDGVVHAFDAATGAVTWTHRMDVSGDLQSAVFGGGASYFDGRVYVTNGAGEVAALDAQTGSEIWKVTPAGPLRGAPTVAFNTVFVMTQDNQIHALNITNGAPVWQDFASTGQAGVFGVAAPAAGQGTVIAGYSTGELVAYRYENGRNLWSDALARTSISTAVGTLTDVDADPIIDNGKVYALGQGGRMAAYDLTTGQRVWELTLAGISTPTIAGNWIFTLTDEAKLYAIDRNTGRVRWETQLPRYRNEKKKSDPIFWSGPLLAGNRLWMANTDGQLYLADAGTGSASPYTDIKAGVSLPPLAANQMLYILDDSGRITAWR
ncbi:PQQ-binding-like beta-propeller repeat protein [Altericroceibacterium xinjiangense]|uniref:outer membrane protein assembly factor BamB family protein n=1 Tax=Altericroceibacterium xinjiangense TaxID=762261 RepID=UPI001F49D8B0|nr:PQQ-binding-like beta-propeller repeat protein [Altericroceibacterium xinjiangense]